jgi:hypothetical protein
LRRSRRTSTPLHRPRASSTVFQTSLGEPPPFPRRSPSIPSSTANQAWSCVTTRKKPQY